MNEASSKSTIFASDCKYVNSACLPLVFDCSSQSQQTNISVFNAPTITAPVSMNAACRLYSEALFPPQTARMRILRVFHQYLIAHLSVSIPVPNKFLKTKPYKMHPPSYISTIIQQLNNKPCLSHKHNQHNDICSYFLYISHNPTMI
ncbi:hypothetical protein L195_g036197 [Trifolium pratense]|uniref:Uncharacterized protein n=1 Tax=Trifolium pratense TaxID=57577 RepID=A0A2K3LNU5_TRIPR|nr:hypothetical protein L195_g036197 [Trifolium pratense]